MAGRPKRRAREHAEFPRTRKPGVPQRGCYTSASTWQRGLNFAADCSTQRIESEGLAEELLELLDDHAFHLAQWDWFVSAGKIITDSSDHFDIRTLCDVRRKTDTRVSWRPSSRRGN